MKKQELIKLTKANNSITVRPGSKQYQYWIDQGFKDLETKEIDNKKQAAIAEVNDKVIDDVVEEVKKTPKKRVGRRKKTEAKNDSTN